MRSCTPSFGLEKGGNFSCRCSPDGFAQGLFSGGFDALDGSEAPDQFLRGLFADAVYLPQGGVQRAFLSLGALEGDGKAVRLVADAL